MYSAITMGFTLFIGLFLLDTAVVIRIMGFIQHESGHNLTLDISRMFMKSGRGAVETISNIAVFVPFGFFLAEFLASLKRFSIGRKLWFAAMTAFSLSLLIECLQLVLKVGYFEVKDLVLNTLGGFVGALMSVGVRKVVGREVIDFNP